MDLLKTMQPNMLLCFLLLLVSIGCRGLTEKESPELEAEFSADTDSCVEAARLKHKNNPNAGLDHFLNCLLKHVSSLQEKEENQEIDEIKTTLDKIENIPLFSNDGFNHNLVKRQSEDEEEKEEVELNDENTELPDEGRGWKKNGEKKKKKEKRNKKNKNKKKYKLKDLSEEIIQDKEDEGEEKDMNMNQSISEDIEESKPAEPKIDPYTNGIQFSAYSGSPQPSYRPPPPRKEQGNKFLYSMDYQGNAQYMDEAAVSVLLRSPQAMKAMMNYLSKEQEQEEGQIPSRLQEHFQQSPYQGYRVPETSLYDSKPPQDPYSNRKTIPRPKHPRPQVPRPPLPRSQKIPGFNTGPPKMEFFGPKDYVPELPHLIQGVKMYPQSQRRIETPYPEKKSNYLILEPKPRSLHRNRRDAEENPEFQHKFGFFPNLGRKKQPIQSKKKERTRVDMALVESKELSEKDKKNSNAKMIIFHQLK